jgi:hypothetical protein
MKKKTIKILLQKKFEDFCSSIDDESVKKLVGKNSIITGGSIASMLLGEKVNDYDLYFTDKQTTLAVAKYYVEKFNLNPPVKFKNSDKFCAVYAVDDNDRIKIIVKSAGIAGEENPDNYQYFETIQNPESVDAINYVEEVAKALTDTDSQKPRYRPVFLSTNAITLSNDIQIVVRFYGNPEQIHENYDFLHCKNYWLSSTGELNLNPLALESLLAKELVYNGSKYPLCSIIRTRKFINRGWTCNAGQYLKMCYQLAKLNLDNVDVLEDQLIGVDSAYFQNLIEALKKQKENDPSFSYGFEYIATIVDKLF